MQLCAYYPTYTYCFHIYSTYTHPPNTYISPLMQYGSLSSPLFSYCLIFFNTGSISGALIGLNSTRLAPAEMYPSTSVTMTLPVTPTMSPSKPPARINCAASGPFMWFMMLSMKTASKGCPATAASATFATAVCPSSASTISMTTGLSCSTASKSWSISTTSEHMLPWPPLEKMVGFFKRVLFSKRTITFTFSALSSTTSTLKSPALHSFLSRIRVSGSFDAASTIHRESSF